MKKNILTFFLCSFLLPLFSQEMFELKGWVTDAVTGERLVGVNVYNEATKTGVVTDFSGKYSLQLEKETEYKIVFSYLGYEMQTKTILSSKDKTLNLRLEASNIQLKEVQVSAKRPDVNVTQNVMGVEKLPMITIRKMPALMGEVDVIKSIQLFPGVQAAAEGTSGFSVRGGGIDHNLILLDEVPVYNATHLMGFFSVFNNDAVKEATLYKGDIPAFYGGRLASVLDVSMLESNSEKLSGTGGIGLISSRLALEGPVINDKLNVIVTGRRTYADLFLRLSPNEDLRDNTLYFYDLTLKAIYKINAKNRISVSGYLGQDKFGMSMAEMHFGNKMLQTSWNHLFSDTFFSNFTLMISNYQYGLHIDIDELGYDWKAGITDYTAKYDFTKLINPRNTLRFGVQGSFRRFNPGTVKNVGASSMFGDIQLPKNQMFDYAVYVSNEQKITETFSVKYGLRASLFQNLGKATIYEYDEDWNRTDSMIYGSGKVFNSDWTLEPRLGLVWLLNPTTSLKASFSRTAQYVQQSTKSSGGMPVDMWFPSNTFVEPQRSNQYAAGIFKNFNDNKFETSVEVYYKTITDLVDFKDNANLIGNANIETEILTGKGRSYGIEMLVRKNEGKLTGWISYTYSRSFRTVEGISFGKEYRSPYDRPHNIVVVLNYDFSKRVNGSASWIYNTGQPVTYPSGKFLYDNLLIPVYSGYRNTYRYPDYHRLDLSVTIKGKEKPNKRWRGEWNVSIYNAYARKNTWSVMFLNDKDNPNQMKTTRLYLFSVVPSVTYNFYF